MIYIVALAVAPAAFGFYRKARHQGIKRTLLDTVVSAAFGWLAGILIGVGARIGMWAIPFFNGTESRFTLDGTLQVVLVFSLYGIGLGILYELIFRGLLRKSGLLFGILVTLFTWYPLGAAGAQQLNFQPSMLPLVFFSGLFVALMFVPFSLLLELLIRRWHLCHDKVPESLAMAIHTGR